MRRRRKRIKLQRQRDSMDCGPASLAMIIRYYGREPDIDRLRRLCALGKTGVSLLGISKAAEAEGLKTIGGRLSLDSLIEEAPLPCVVHWDQNHFVVLYKVRRSHRRRGDCTLYAADPGKGLMEYDRISFIYSWQDVSISLERMSEIHEEADEEDADRTRSRFPEDSPAGRSIEIEGVSFKYDPYSPQDILSDIRLSIPNGKVTAIVGASGSGKTTLIKLLLGCYEPQKGRITVGGIDLREYSLAWWRSECGAVMQEGYLFSDTIARNIAISADKPDIDRIRAAARVAQIADYIEALPLAYNTRIGQDGQGISQGQRQRLLIARVVYKDPTIVLLDEATNSLDANNERHITEALRTFYAGKTVVIVAHRLSTIRGADHIVVLDKGQIVEEGTHDELTAMRGRYYSLVRNQLELGN